MSLEECESAHSACGQTFECGSADLYSLTHDSCDSMDAVGDGACFCFLGFAWNGAGCVDVNGCQCDGADCDKLSMSLEECESAHSSCGQT